MKISTAALITVGTLLGSTLAANDYELIPFRSAPFQPLKTKSWSSVVKSTGRNYTAYMGIVEDASLFEFALPPGGCFTRHNTSTTAEMFGCQMATNGGFFSFSGGCVGDVVINNTVVSWDSSDKAAFGILPDGKTLVGYVSSQTDFAFKSMLSGNGWLVRDGQSYVNQSREFVGHPHGSFVMLKAPRTAVGVMEDGSIMLAVVDGIEVTKEGLDLYEFAEILIEQGAKHVVNLDGGGSTDAVLNGKVWSRPTCSDYPNICERAVTTVACIKYPEADGLDGSDGYSFLQQ